MKAQFNWQPNTTRPANSIDEILVMDNDGGYGVFYWQVDGDFLFNSCEKLNWKSIRRWMQLPCWEDEIEKVSNPSNPSPNTS